MSTKDCTTLCHRSPETKATPQTLNPKPPNQVEPEKEPSREGSLLDATTIREAVRLSNRV